MDEYSDISKQLTGDLDKQIKDGQGIFFSPPKSIRKTINYIDHILKHEYKTVLEPSCGSCEFINYLDNKDNLDITGVEYNSIIYDKIKDLKFKNNVKLFNDDFLEIDIQKKFDLIIGNPPYFVYKKKDINKKYHKYLKGRPNIFLPFILKSLDLLNENGILAFILPKSCFNCGYYVGVREYIYHNFGVKNIIDFSDHEYIETQQDTFLLVLKKTRKKLSNDKFFIKNDYIMNTRQNISSLKNIINNSSTLHNLGFTVFNGKFVWNQEKPYLTNVKEDNVRLIYSGDIVNGKLNVLDDDIINSKWKDLINKYEKKPTKALKDKIDKKHYVKNGSHKNKITKGMTLIINRGYGNTDYILEFSLVDNIDEYFLENHVLAIDLKNKDTFTKDIIEKKYQQIIESFKDPRTKEFIDLCMGNNAINTTELEYLIPIFI
jgi:adenine-specific DNA-methyltransferase